jgi:hypothetical protein
MLGLAVAAMLAIAADKGSQPAVAAAPGDIVVKGEKAKEKRLTCRTETPTGSSFARRVCRTASQIEEQQAQSAKFMEEADRIHTLQSTTQLALPPK